MTDFPRRVRDRQAASKLPCRISMLILLAILAVCAVYPLHHISCKRTRSQSNLENQHDAHNKWSVVAGMRCAGTNKGRWSKHLLSHWSALDNEQSAEQSSRQKDHNAKITTATIHCHTSGAKVDKSNCFHINY